MLTLRQLLSIETREAIYDAALAIAEGVGLPVTTWQTGDPTRSLYHVLAAVLSALETVVQQALAGGYLDEAEGDFLTLLAEQVYSVVRQEGGYATCSVRLTNTGASAFDFDAGDVTVKSSVNGKTYHNTSGGILASGPGTTLDLDFIADEVGSDSSALVGEIDTAVTTLNGVTVANLTAAIGTDEEADAALRSRCRAKLGALSPNGPAAAYHYVATTSDLTGTTGITRTRVLPDSDTGAVVVYLAGPAGAVSGGDVDAAEAAILEWATPLCITPTVSSAANLSVPVTYNLRVYRSVNKTEAEVKTAVSEALAEAFAARPIGGDILDGDTTGKLYQSFVASTIRSTFPEAFHVTVSAPAADVSVANSEVVTLGTVTGTITFTDDP